MALSTDAPQQRTPERTQTRERPSMTLMVPLEVLGSPVRPEASSDTGMVNVVADRFTRAPSEGDQDHSSRVHLHLVAWVKNVAYAKQVWVEWETAGGLKNGASGEGRVDLTYVAPADNGGDLFEAVVDLPWASDASPESAFVAYRIYYSVNGELFTDALQHVHGLAELETRSTREGGSPLTLDFFLLG